MSFRLDEGNGYCMYRIGVEDDGCHSLLDYEECAETAKVLEYIARSLNAVVLERIMIQNEIVNDKEGNPVKSSGTLSSIPEPSLLGDGREHLFDDQAHNLQGEKKTTDWNQIDKGTGVYTRGELTIQRIETHMLDPPPVSLKELAKSQEEPGASNGQDHGEKSTNASSEHKTAGEAPLLSETLSSRNIRVAVVGNVDAGKSTMIGTLTSSSLDDGRGSSRTSIMKHRHEIESGRTSTASTHLMGFKSTGEAIAGKDSLRTNRRKSEDEVAKESYRVITLMDLAGHEKYLKTT